MCTMVAVVGVICDNIDMANRKHYLVLLCHAKRKLIKKLLLTIRHKILSNPAIKRIQTKQNQLFHMLH